MHFVEQYVQECVNVYVGSHDSPKADSHYVFLVRIGSVPRYHPAIAIAMQDSAR
jgi:hypothetical protein